MPRRNQNGRNRIFMQSKRKQETEKCDQSEQKKRNCDQNEQKKRNCDQREQKNENAIKVTNMSRNVIKVKNRNANDKEKIAIKKSRNCYIEKNNHIEQDVMTRDDVARV